MSKYTRRGKNNAIADIRDAYHEAGHAVVGVLRCGLHLDYVTLARDPHAHVKWRRGEPLLLKAVPMILAGAYSDFCITEFMKLPVAGFRTPLASGWDDTVQAKHIISQHYATPEDEEAALHQFLDDTEQAVHGNWDKIKTVAERLIRERYLSGDQVMVIIA